MMAKNAGDETLRYARKTKATPYELLVPKTDSDVYSVAQPFIVKTCRLQAQHDNLVLATSARSSTWVENREQRQKTGRVS